MYQHFGLDDVELLSATQVRLTRQLFCEWRPPVERIPFTGISKYSLHATVSLGVSLFYISVSSPYFAHFVAHFISAHVV